MLCIFVAIFTHSMSEFVPDATLRAQIVDLWKGFDNLFSIIEEGSLQDAKLTEYALPEVEPVFVPPCSFEFGRPAALAL